MSVLACVRARVCGVSVFSALLVAPGLQSMEHGQSLPSSINLTFFQNCLDCKLTWNTSQYHTYICNVNYEKVVFVPSSTALQCSSFLPCSALYRQTSLRTCSSSARRACRIWDLASTSCRRSLSEEEMSALFPWWSGDFGKREREKQKIQCLNWSILYLGKQTCPFFGSTLKHHFKTRTAWNDVPRSADGSVIYIRLHPN